MTALRSSLFLVGGFLITAIFGMLVPAFGLFSYRAGLYLARSWARWVLKWAEWSCGIRHEVRGMENVPARPAVIMSKHQSAWETLYIEATPVNENTVNATFDIAGLSEAIKPLRESCGW